MSQCCSLDMADGLMTVAQTAPWQFAPEGAIVHRATRTAVIADVHLGYEWSRARGGDVLPAHTLLQTLGRIESLMGRVSLSRLVVAGDVVESAAPCPRTIRDLRSLLSWLDARGIEVVLVRGNHDSAWSGAQSDASVIAGWTIHHGHTRLDCEPMIIGHHHPAIGVDGRLAACFLASERCIVLPAFSDNAAGFDVRAAGLPPSLRGYNFRCVASSGETLFDFGPLDRLSR